MPGMSRRTFLWLTGGSGVALAGEQSRKVINRLIPQVIPPEQIKPGEWVSFATTCRECPAGCGMHLLHRDGRATKAEGNPLQPVNRGALCPRGQASVQGLYDPDRLRHVLHRRSGVVERRTWNDAFSAISERLAGGGRTVVVSRLETGSLAEVMGRFAGQFGQGKPLLYEPFSHAHLSAAHERLFGQRVIPRYNLEKSTLIVSFGADFLESWISPVEFAAGYAAMHAFGEAPAARSIGGRGVGGFIYVGPRLSMTAANADRFVSVAPDQIPLVALTMVKTIIERGLATGESRQVRETVIRRLADSPPLTGVTIGQIEDLAVRFATAADSVALPGATGASGTTAEETATAVALLNFCAGRHGRTVDFSRPHALSLAVGEGELVRQLESLTSRDTLFIHNANPVYSLGRGKELVSRAGMTVYLGTQPDETAVRADWVLPVDHSLEGWGDYEPWAGVSGLLQPVMGRLYDTLSPGDIFMELAARAGAPLFPLSSGSPGEGYADLLRRRWREHAAGSTFEAFWTDTLRNGGVWSEKRAGKQPSLNRAGPLFTTPLGGNTMPSGEVNLWLWPSIMLHDGRVANRGWLQEAPDPVTFRVWGNWVDLHPSLGSRLGIRDGELVELTAGTGRVVAPVRITTDVHEHTVALGYGQGHTELGRNARGVGVNAFLLESETSGAGMFGTCRIRKIAGPQGEEAVPTDGSTDQHGREILQWISLPEARSLHPGEGEELHLPLPEGYLPGRDMYPRRRYLQHRWAMVVDLDRCIGCGACGVACYAENNVAVIGREKVAHGREMAWLRVPPYRKPDNTALGWLPMFCQHCDAAPCEPVCPVYAAVHNEEGLNAQVYNRCIGTRYCSNNCPYKVRRFNWINVTWPEPLHLQLNPEVTVRSRGVMEKCTFCIQRIRQAEYRARRERRRVRDGEIQPACVQTCPTRVFTFGDLLDPESLVSRMTRNDPRRYQVLGELNTKPAVTYLKRVKRSG